MKKTFLTLIVVFFFLFIFINGSGQIQHDFICIDNFKENYLIRVSELNPNNCWVTEIPKGSRDLQLLSENELLVSHGNGAAIYNLETGKKIKLITDKYAKIQSAQFHKDGFYYLLTIDGKIVKLDKYGNEIDQFKIKRDLDLRLLRFTEKGDFLISCKKPMAVMIVDSKGNVIKEISMLDKGYKTLQLPNGNFLNTAGDEVKVVEHTSKGEIVRFVGGIEEHKSLKLDYASGWDLLPNGNIVLCNWLGHDKHGTAPHLIEFTPENKSVWKWEDHQLAKQVTNVLFLK